MEFSVGQASDCPFEGSRLLDLDAGDARVAGRAPQILLPAEPSGPALHRDGVGGSCPTGSHYWPESGADNLTLGKVLRYFTHAACHHAGRSYTTRDFALVVVVGPFTGVGSVAIGLNQFQPECGPWGRDRGRSARGGKCGCGRSFDSWQASVHVDRGTQSYRHE
jgi:hypothetical protein